MKPFTAICGICFFVLWIVTYCHGNRCHHRRFRRCAGAVSSLSIPMLESSHHRDFNNPQKTARKFCRQVHPKLNCAYNQLLTCEGEEGSYQLEERAGVLSYLCGEGRRVYIGGSDCWKDNDVSGRLQYCRVEHGVDDIVTSALADNITDTSQACSALQEYAWQCVGDWAMNRCEYNMAAFLIRLVNPDILTLRLRCS